MKCVLILFSIVILQCAVYSIQLTEPKVKSINKVIQVKDLLRNDLDTAASFDNWHHTVTKHIHSHRHEVNSSCFLKN